MPTTAPDIASLFDLETAFLSAVLPGFADSGFTAHTLRGEAIEKTPHVELTFDVGPVTEHYGKRPDNSDYPDTWHCTFSVTIVTNRRTRPLERHGREVGRVRDFMQRIGDHFTPDKLPWHTIARCVEKGTQTKADSDRECDETSIQFEVIMSILDTAWPA